MDELKKLGERHHLIKEVRGRGLMIGLELEANDERFSVASLYRDLLARRFLVGYTPAANLLRFYPALTIDKKDIAQLVENLDHILEELL